MAKACAWVSRTLCNCAGVRAAPTSPHAFADAASCPHPPYAPIDALLPRPSAPNKLNYPLPCLSSYRLTPPLQVESLDLLEPHVDEKNFSRTCLYLTSCCAYLPEPDDAAVLRLALRIYTTRWGWEGAGVGRCGGAGAAALSWYQAGAGDKEERARGHHQMGPGRGGAGHAGTVCVCRCLL